MQKKYLIIIVGPTAIGKTALAINLATYYGSTILSVDSRQCYKEMSIGTAKPSMEERRGILHYFIDTHSIQNTISVKSFESYADNILTEKLVSNNPMIAVGGSGLFVNVLLYGIDCIPPIPSDLRSSIKKQYEQWGISWLQQQIHTHDIEYAHNGEMKNPQRMIRALEVVLQTGKSIGYFQKGRKKELHYIPILIGLRPQDMPQLHQRIVSRTKQMIALGLEKEVRKLQQHNHLNALQTVGYKEWELYLKAQETIQQVQEKIIIKTRQYAKRQMTWFNKNKLIKWFSIGDDFEYILGYIEQATKQKRPIEKS